MLNISVVENESEGHSITAFSMAIDDTIMARAKLCVLNFAEHVLNKNVSFASSVLSLKFMWLLHPNLYMCIYVHTIMFLAINNSAAPLQQEKKKKLE